MQPCGRNRYGPKIGGGCAPLGKGELGPHLTQCGQTEAYLHVKFHLDPSNRLATVQQRYREDRQTDRQTDNGLIAYGEPFYKRSAKNWKLAPFRKLQDIVLCGFGH